MAASQSIARVRAQRLLLLLCSSSRCASALANAPALRRVAIVTGGTRGIGYGISEALAGKGYDLLLTYNTDEQAAKNCADQLRSDYHDCHVECVGGDLSLPETRDAIFACYDRAFDKSKYELGAVVHNAGQYVGITAQNTDKLNHASRFFGDGSLLDEATGGANLELMKYYQRLYGDAYVDLLERGIARMTGRGHLIGISSPGSSLQYRPSPGYDMQGSGKCVMEFAMRLFALRCAPRGINCNVVIPGVTATDAWGKLAERQGKTREEFMQEYAEMIVPMKCSMLPRDVGEVVAFLCSPEGRFITGVSLPTDGGVHLK